MLSPKKLRYQQINKIITICVVWMDMFHQEIVIIFILFVRAQNLVGQTRSFDSALRQAGGDRQDGSGREVAPPGGAVLRS